MRRKTPTDVGLPLVFAKRTQCGEPRMLLTVPFGDRRRGGRSRAFRPRCVFQRTLLKLDFEACLPTMGSSAAIFALYSLKKISARASSSNAPVFERHADKG
jgi:hypothetical protein